MPPPAMLAAHEDGHALICTEVYSATCDKVKKDLKGVPGQSDPVTAGSCDLAAAFAVALLKGGFLDQVSADLHQGNQADDSASTAYDNATQKGTVGNQDQEAKKAANAAIKTLK